MQLMLQCSLVLYANLFQRVRNLLKIGQIRQEISNFFTCNVITLL